MKRIAAIAWIFVVPFIYIYFGIKTLFTGNVKYFFIAIAVLFLWTVIAVPVVRFINSKKF